MYLSSEVSLQLSYNCSDRHHSVELLPGLALGGSGGAERESDRDVILPVVGHQHPGLAWLGGGRSGQQRNLGTRVKSVNNTILKTVESSRKSRSYYEQMSWVTSQNNILH